MPDGKYTVDEILEELRQRKKNGSPDAARKEAPIPDADNPVISRPEPGMKLDEGFGVLPEDARRLPEENERDSSVDKILQSVRAARAASVQQPAGQAEEPAAQPSAPEDEAPADGGAEEKPAAVSYAAVHSSQEDAGTEPDANVTADAPAAPNGALASTFLSRLRNPNENRSGPDVEPIPQDAMSADESEPEPVLDVNAPTQDFSPVRRRRVQQGGKYTSRYMMDTAELDAEAPTKVAGGAPQLPGDTDPVEEKYHFLRDRRQKKVDAFVLQNGEEPKQAQQETPKAASGDGKSAEQAAAPAEAAPDTPDKTSAAPHPVEYTDPSDALSVRAYFRKLRSRLLIRLGGTAACALALLIFAIPGALDPAAPGMTYTAILAPMIALVLSAAVSFRSMLGGFRSATRFRADCDSLTGLAVLWALAQCVVLLIFPGSMVEFQIDVFCLLPGLTLFFNTLGKFLHLRRVTEGFERLATAPEQAKKELHAAAVISRRLSSEFSQIAELDAPIAAVSVEADFLTDYIQIANTPDPSDRVMHTLFPAALLTSLGVFLLSFLLNSQNAAIAVSVAAASFCICAPFSGVLCAALPMWRFNRQAARENAWVSGFGAADEFEDVDTVVVDANELFPAGSIVLHGIKTLGMDKIDDHILDAASIVCYAKSTLAPIFLQVIENRTALLRPVDNVVIEDGMGLAGWVNGRRVLVGNRDLLQNHGIDVPSREYENRYLKDNRDIVYLATSGEISAMFIISYSADPKIETALIRLLRTDLSMLVRSTDPNITARKLAGIFTFPVNMIRLIPGKSYADYRRLTRRQSRASAALMLDGSLSSLAASLSAVRRIKRSLSLSTLLQTIGVIAGFMMIAVYGLTCSTDMGVLHTGLLLLWQSVWSLFALAVSFFQRV